MASSFAFCVGASSGGHLTELAALLDLRSMWPAQPNVYVTTLSISTDMFPDESASYSIGECDRKRPFKAMKTLFRSIRVASRVKPDVVLTTGSLPLAIFCLVSKFFGAKIVWIDSISQIDRLSISGQLVRPFSDLFFVQWPELSRRYKGVIYAGELV